MSGPPPVKYPIRVVAQMTGLSLDTLRAWERRYEAVTPHRGERGRLYSEADVTRLRRLGRLVNQGHAIGSIAHLDDASLARLMESAAALVQTPSAASARPDDIIAALDGYDLTTIEQSLNRLATILPPREFIWSVVTPLLKEIGDRWAEGRLRPAQEHLVSALVRSVLGGLLRTLTRPDATPRVVFAAPSGERHELGLLSAAVLAASEGFGIVYLGPDLPASDIWHAATVSQAAVVIVALTTPGAVLETELRRLAAVPDGCRLWVGGPAAAELHPRLGSDGQHLTSLADVIPALDRHAR